ncbi:hypothetical protein [Jiella pacifica]|uniref:Uncharacterized protein n=1 Tax=Jiella pacifica TaxID=2696469 RepID=A0A6N9T0U8_9HYPH|nr:hypothetical protein [Jiella pacifica]NDW03549.1 hypothetical protein [Jiella pacifica]
MSDGPPQSTGLSLSDVQEVVKRELNRRYRNITIISITLFMLGNGAALYGVYQYLDKQVKESIISAVSTRSKELLDSQVRIGTEELQRKMAVFEDRIATAKAAAELAEENAKNVNDNAVKSINKSVQAANNNLQNYLSNVDEASSNLASRKKEIDERAENLREVYEKAQNGISTILQTAQGKLNSSEELLEKTKEETIRTEERLKVEARRITGTLVELSNSVQVETLNYKRKIELLYSDLDDASQNLNKLRDQVTTLSNADFVKLTQYIELIKKNKEISEMLEFGVKFASLSAEVGSLQQALDRSNDQFRIAQEGLARVQAANIGQDAHLNEIETEMGIMKRNSIDFESQYRYFVNQFSELGKGQENIRNNINRIIDVIGSEMVVGSVREWELCPEKRCYDVSNMSLRALIPFDINIFGNKPIFISSVNTRSGGIYLDGASTSYNINDGMIEVIVRWQGPGKPDVELANDNQFRVDYIMLPERSLGGPG